MAKTPLLLSRACCARRACLPPQIAALADGAEIVVPDWRQAPLSIWDSWESAARWVRRPDAGREIRAGRPVAGRHAGRRDHADRRRPRDEAGAARHRHAQPERDRARDPPRPHPPRQRRPFRAGAGPADVALHPGLSPARQGAGRRGDGDVRRDRRRDLQAPGGAGGDPRRPPARPAADQVPDHRGVRPRRRRDAAVPVGGDRRGHHRQRA